MDADVVAWLEQWYQAHCNGDWEHRSGIRIETLDNPGWHVRIDLEGTGMADKPFAQPDVGQGADDGDWLYCDVQDGAFDGYGGPGQLGAILHAFQEWCARFPSRDMPLSPQQQDLIDARESIERVRRVLGGKNGPEECRADGCERLHVAHSVFCGDHHIANLQRVGALPVISADGLRVLRRADD